MTSITIGPLALPVGPLLLALAAAVAIWLADRLAAKASPEPGPTSASAGDVLLRAVGVGLLVARLAHVGRYHEAYLQEPWAVLDVRDGGWNAWAGLFGGAGWLAWRTWRRVPWRRPLAVAGAAGLAIWSAGSLGLALLTPRDLPDVPLQELATGQAVSLRALGNGQPVVVNLWASWCGPCRSEMPVLAAAQARHPDVVFVFANQGERPQAIHRYLAAEGLALSNVLLDAQSRLGPALGSSGLPTTVFFDRHGRRVAAHLGALNGPALEGKIGTVLAR